MSGWIVFLVLLNAYILLLFWLVRSGRMEKWNLSLLMGFILMIRTQRGKKLIDRISKPKRLWNAFGDFSTVLTLGGMVLGAAAMILAVSIFFQRPEGAPEFGASEVIIIPGVTPFVPLWSGLAALIITLVIHEGAHGVLARANNMKVRSIGLLYVIVPVGAFVEPDEEELMASPRRNRLRVYAAGASINIVVSLVILLLFASLIAAATPIAGAAVATVIQDQPAAEADLQPGDIIVAADGQAISNWTEFRLFMYDQFPGDPIIFETKEGATHTLEPKSRWQVLSRTQQEGILAWPGPLEDGSIDRDGPGVAGGLFCQRFFRSEQQLAQDPADEPLPLSGSDCAERLETKSYIGISAFQTTLEQERLASPFAKFGHFGLVMQLPIGEIRGAPYLSTYLPTFLEAPFNEDLYWALVNLVFFTFWINFLVGLTNVLPMVPLDGGHIFRDTVGGVLAKVRPRLPEEKRDRLAARASVFVSFAILIMFLIPLLGPRFL